jgi:hypothetical protein
MLETHVGYLISLIKPAAMSLSTSVSILGSISGQHFLCACFQRSITLDGEMMDSHL